MKQKKGFTIIELVVAVGVIGVLSSISAYGYLQIIPKIQASEALKLMDAERSKITKNLARGYCSNNASGAKGKYGTLVVSGNYAGKSESKCPTGCRLTYTFKSEGVHPKIREKVLSVDFLQNSSLSKVASISTLGEKYTPDSITTSTPPETCPVIPNAGANHSWSDVNVAEDDIGGTETSDAPRIESEDNGGGGSGNGNGNGNGNGGGENSDPDAVDDNSHITPLKPQDPPKSDAERQARINDVAERLSRGSEMVFIEPQGFDFTVTAKPKSDNGKFTCEDKITVKANESIVRIGANNWFDIAGPFYVRNQLQLLNEIAHPLGYKKIDGYYHVDKPVTIYNSCVVAVINGSPRLPSIITNSYKIVDQGAITFQVFGYISGRGGNGNVLNIDPQVELHHSYFMNIENPNYDFELCKNNVPGTCHNYDYKAVRIATPKITQIALNSREIERQHWGDKYRMHATTRGGVAISNLNTSYPIHIFAHRNIRKGLDAYSVSMYTWYNVTDINHTNKFVDPFIVTLSDHHESRSLSRPLTIGFASGIGGEPYGSNPIFYFRGERKLEDKNWDPSFKLPESIRTFKFRERYKEYNDEIRLGFVEPYRCVTTHLFRYSQLNKAPYYRFDSTLPKVQCRGTGAGKKVATGLNLPDFDNYKNALNGSFIYHNLVDGKLEDLPSSRSAMIYGLNAGGLAREHCLTGNGEEKSYRNDNGDEVPCFLDP